MASIDERPNSDGSVSYRVYWNLPKQMIPIGQTKAKASLTVYTRKDALKAKEIAEKYKHAITGPDVEDELAAERARAAGTGAMTLRRWYAIWIDSLRESPELSQRQIDTYAGQFTREILPAVLTDSPRGQTLGDKALEELEAIDIQNLYKNLAAKPMAPATVKTYHAALRSCLNAATTSPKRSGITANPVKGISLSNKSVIDVEREPEKFFEREQYELILQGINPDSRLLVQFLAETGARFSEATALKVKDLNWDTRIAKIDRAHKRTYSGKLIDTPGQPKGKSDRWVEVTPRVMEELHLHVERQKIRDNEFLFRAPRNGPVHHSNFLDRRWTPTLQRLSWCPRHMPVDGKSRSTCLCLGDINWTNFKPHALRHSWATWAILAGVKITYVSRQLGHPDTAFTERTYVHLFKSRSLGTGNAIEAYLERSGK